MGERLKGQVHLAMSHGTLAEIDRRLDGHNGVDSRSAFIERAVRKYLAAEVAENDVLLRLAAAVIKESESGHDWPEWIEIVQLARDAQAKAGRKAQVWR